MDIDSTGSSNWLFDYEIMDDLAVVGSSPTTGFSWPSQPVHVSPKIYSEVDCSLGDSGSLKVVGRKRMRSESSCASGSKACREKLRRDRLNERFMELASFLEPGRPLKTDKSAILSDACRTVIHLRFEAEKLKECNEDLQAKIKELKAEKNELRDEKQRLKAEKEKLEQQVKAMSSLRPPSAMSAAFTAQGQAAGNKLMPFVGFPGIAMWQFMPPAAIDISEDHVLRPPVA